MKRVNTNYSFVFTFFFMEKLFNGDVMKNKLSYIIMSVFIFNVLFTFYYYFKIVSFFYIDLFFYSRLINFFLINAFICFIDATYIILYHFVNLEEFSYFNFVLIGMFLGVCFSFITLGINGYDVSDYLSIISFFIINTIFLSYSLSFEKEKKRVFE